MASELGNVLRAARTAANLTQAEFAQRLGISRAAVGQWESGVHEPSTDNLIRACRILGVDVDAALEGRVSSSDKAVSAQGNKTDKLSALSEYKLVSGLVKVVSEARSDKDKSSVPMFLAHSYPNDDAIFVIVEEFSRSPKLLMLKDKSDIYTISMPNKSLYPLYDEYQHVYIDPEASVSIGDFALVRTREIEKLAMRDGIDGLPAEKCFLGKIIGYNMLGIQLMQFNPERTIDLPITGGEVIHRIPQAADLIPLAR